MEKIKKILISLSHKDSGKKFFITDTEKDFHTKFGFLKSADLKKLKPGKEIVSNRNEKFVCINPDFIDSYKKIKRGAQIISLKDAGTIVAETGIGKNSVVLDSGSGSGALSLLLANIAKKVYSYEIDKDNFELVKENIKFLGVKNLELKNKNVYEGIDEKNLDVVIFDLPEPWNAIDHAEKSLKIGGFLVNYSPCVPPLMDFIEKLNKKTSFIVLKTVEITETRWEFRERTVRPLSKGIGHTGFLCFARKIS